MTLTKNQNIQKFSKVHGTTYDYSMYLKSDKKYRVMDKIPIICKKHGVFFKSMNNHKRGQGCPKCKTRRRKTKVEHIQDLVETHGDRYDYSLYRSPSVVTKNTKDKIPIICRRHGVFYQTIATHKAGSHCPLCMRAERKNKKIQKHISEFNIVHNGEYDYSEALKLGHDPKSSDKIPIICSKHGLFYQEIDNHKKGRGCPKCSSSKGEKLVQKLLDANGICHERERKFVKLGRKRFDFYLPNHNAVIEYHGQQHYEPVGFFGGAKNFKKQQASDRIKKEFCESNNIQYIEIPYTMTDKQVEDTIKALLK